jgi:hypothetical protein
VNQPAPELRTRYPVPLTAPRPEPETCIHCHAVLRTQNHGRGICDPCEAAGKAAPIIADPDAPLCACGCGGRTHRPMTGGRYNREKTTGPYLLWCHGHHRKGVTNGETESREPLESGSQPAATV